MRLPIAVCLPLYLLLFTACGAGSSEEQADDDYTRGYHANGKLASEVKYIDGVKHGVARSYYEETGEMHLEITYNMGQKDGLTKTFYEDGKLYRETLYKKNQKHGIEKTYHENGKLASEMPWWEGFPGAGLKEYREDGSLIKKKLPKIIVSEKNTLPLDNSITLTLTTDPKRKKLEYYLGPLVEGKYMNAELEPIPTKDGSGKYRIYLSKGAFAMKTLTFIAKYKTRSRNYEVLHVDYNLAVDNKAI